MHTVNLVRWECLSITCPLSMSVWTGGREEGHRTRGGEEEEAVWEVENWKW